MYQRTPAGPSDEYVDTGAGSSRRKSNNKSKKDGQGLDNEPRCIYSNADITI